MSGEHTQGLGFHCQALKLQSGLHTLALGPGQLGLGLGSHCHTLKLGPGLHILVPRPWSTCSGPVASLSFSELGPGQRTVEFGSHHHLVHQETWTWRVQRNHRSAAGLPSRGRTRGARRSWSPASGPSSSAGACPCGSGSWSEIWMNMLMIFLVSTNKRKENGKIGWDNEKRKCRYFNKLTEGSWVRTSTSSFKTYVSKPHNPFT